MTGNKLAAPAFAYKTQRKTFADDDFKAFFDEEIKNAARLTGGARITPEGKACLDRSSSLAAPFSVKAYVPQP